MKISDIQATFNYPLNPPANSFVYARKYLAMIHTAEGYYSIKDYAGLCGVSPRNISDRIKARIVHPFKIHHFRFISVHQNPPARRLHRFSRLPKPKPPPAHFSFDGLKEVGIFARSKHFHEGIIYEWIITGKLDGYVIANKVFIRPPEAEKLIASY